MMSKSIMTLVLLAVALSAPVDAWWLFNSGAQQTPTRAQAVFDMDGVKGVFKFSQMNAGEPTTVEYDIHGLKDNNNLYHVHVKPVPNFDPAQLKEKPELRQSLCGAPATGGHLNPHNITAKLPPKSAPLDKYEVGDFSGKHGALQKMPAAGGAGHEDHYQGGFTDDKISLKGQHGIIGRSIVVHKNNGDRWVCANILEVSS